MARSNAKFYIGLVFVVLLVVFVYGGIPVGAWMLLGPTLFWQKLAMIVAIALYEWFAFWLGILFGAGIIAVIAD